MYISLSKIILRNSTVVNREDASSMLLKPSSSKPFLSYRLQLSVELKTQTCSSSRNQQRALGWFVSRTPGFAPLVWP